MGVHHSSLQRLVCRRLGIPGIVGGTKMTNSCTCKAEHWQNHVESCPAYKPRPLLTVENIRSGAIPADAFVAGFLLGEIERLRKREGQLMEFLRSFISGGVNQDFKPWARELYQKLYGTHEPCEQLRVCPKCNRNWISGKEECDCESLPCDFCGGKGTVIAQPGNVEMPCPFGNRHTFPPETLRLAKEASERVAGSIPGNPLNDWKLGEDPQCRICNATPEHPERCFGRCVDYPGQKPWIERVTSDRSQAASRDEPSPQHPNALADHINAMCGWAETLAKAHGWRRENAGSFWSSYDAARAVAKLQLGASRDASSEKAVK